MDYEDCFKRLVIDLTYLIEKHVKECAEAERGTFDVDEKILEKDGIESDNAEPVNYANVIKKCAKSKS